MIGIFVAVDTVISWTYRDRPADRPLIVLFGAESGYAFASGPSVSSSDPLVQQLLSDPRYPFGLTVPAAVLYLAIEFAGVEIGQFD